MHEGCCLRWEEAKKNPHLHRENGLRKHPWPPQMLEPPNHLLDCWSLLVPSQWKGRGETLRPSQEERERD
jgi:hypothetical protein